MSVRIRDLNSRKEPVVIRRVVLIVLAVVALLGLVFAVSQSEPRKPYELTTVSAELPSVRSAECPGFAHYVDETGGWWVYATASTQVVKADPSGWWFEASPGSATWVLVMEDNERVTVRWDAAGKPHTDAVAVGKTPETWCARNM